MIEVDVTVEGSKVIIEGATRAASEDDVRVIPQYGNRCFTRTIQLHEQLDGQNYITTIPVDDIPYRRQVSMEVSDGKFRATLY